MMRHEMVEPLPLVVPQRFNPQLHINRGPQQVRRVNRLLPLGMNVALHELSEWRMRLRKDIGTSLAPHVGLYTAVDSRDDGQAIPIRKR